MREPSRPDPLRLITPATSAEEAAAIVAAVEQFVRATARVDERTTQRPDEWLRAAMLDGVSRADRTDASGALDKYLKAARL